MYHIICSYFAKNFLALNKKKYLKKLKIPFDILWNFVPNMGTLLWNMSSILSWIWSFFSKAWIFMHDSAFYFLFMSTFVYLLFLETSINKFTQAKDCIFYIILIFFKGAKWTSKLFINRAWKFRHNCGYYIESYFVP